MQTFSVQDLEIGAKKFTIIAGPCMIESLEICEKVAETLKKLCAQFGFQYIFKSSFDKANRTSVHSRRGISMEQGLQILEHIGKKYQIPTTTDVHSTDQIELVAKGVDLIQIPAFLCRQTDLLEAAAKTKKPVHVKKGQFLAPWDAKNIIQKLEHFKASGILLTERGTSFGYNRLIVDMAGIEIMRSFGHPVCFDATHSVQNPGGAGTSTGGNRDFIPALVRAAIAVGIDALFLEIHPDPKHAHSDKESQWSLDQTEWLFQQIEKIQKAYASLSDVVESNQFDTE